MNPAENILNKPSKIFPTDRGFGNLIDNEIVSMAMPWKQIKDGINNHLSVMVLHLVKIYYYHDFQEYLYHWIESVRKGFDKIPKDSKTNKFPTYNQVFDYIWNVELSGDPDGQHYVDVRDINNVYTDVPNIPIENIDYEGFRKFLLEYCKILANAISLNGAISMDEIEDFIINYDYGFSIKD